MWSRRAWEAWSLRATSSSPTAAGEWWRRGEAAGAGCPAPPQAEGVSQSLTRPTRPWGEGSVESWLASALEARQLTLLTYGVPGRACACRLRLILLVDIDTAASARYAVARRIRVPRARAPCASSRDLHVASGSRYAVPIHAVPVPADFGNHDKGYRLGVRQG